MDTSIFKKQLREECRRIAENLPEEYKSEANDLIFWKVVSSIEWESAQSVFTYVSIQNEPSTRKLIDLALAEGKSVWVPKCVSHGFMEAVRIDSLEALGLGKYGIPEPERGEAASPHQPFDLAIVPCVSASLSGARLGHGGGYYDRFLSSHMCYKLCLCFSELVRDGIPMDGHDILMDRVLTD